MQRVTSDVVIAIGLLVFCGVFFWASFDIREPDYGTLAPSAWPRAILGILSFLSLIYLVQSLRNAPDVKAAAAATDQDDTPRSGGLIGWLAHWRNVIACFVLFFAYLATLPILGMLIGGILFVFLLLTILGGWSLKNLLLHALIACVSIGAMWSLFTFGLGVLLPQGIIFNPF